MCTSVRKRLRLCLNGFVQTESGTPVCLCKKNKCLVILSAFQSDICRQWVCIHVNKAACFSAFTSAALSQDGSTAAQTCCSFFLYSVVSDGEWNRLCLFLLCFKASAVMHQPFLSQLQQKYLNFKIIIIQETGSWGKLVLCTVAWLVGLQLWSRIVGLKKTWKKVFSFLLQFGFK